MRGRIAGALLIATLAGVGVSAPVGAQSCADFAGQKDAQRSLEQIGDPSGLLDPDGNGFACDHPAADPAAGGGGVADAQSFQGTVLAQDAGQNTNTIIISDDGQSVSNNAAGTSNTVLANPGNPNRPEREPRVREERERRDRDRGGSVVEAPAEGAAPAGEFAPMGEPVGEGFVEDVAPAAPDQGAEGASQPAPVLRLPSTGAGSPTRGALPAVLALLGGAAGLAAAGWRWRTAGR